MVLTNVSTFDKSKIGKRKELVKNTLKIICKLPQIYLLKFERAYLPIHFVSIIRLFKFLKYLKYDTEINITWGRYTGAHINLVRNLKIPFY